MPLLEGSHRALEQSGHRAEAGIGQPERWARVKALFMDALQYSESERSAFIARASGDDSELERELRSLLVSDAAAASMFETPAAEILAGLSGGDAEPSRPLAPGTRLGVYEITGFIAAGGMGAVYRGVHTVLGRDVAIKTVGTPLGGSDARRRLVREARHASLLTHPSICAIYDVGEDDGTPFIVMEYVPGKLLGSVIRDGGPPLGVAVEYAIEIAGALEHAHERGIIHRDLKSSNVVINQQDHAVVLDFGLAQRLPSSVDGDEGESSGTYPDALAGTLSHMAPELLRGGRADARSDVWALGVLIYEMLSGALPFTGSTSFETSSAIINDAPPPITAGAPLALRLLVEKCLHKDPEERYQSARAVRYALELVRRWGSWPVLGALMISARRRALYRATLAMCGVALVLFLGVRFRGIPAAGGSDRIATLIVLPLENAASDASVAYYADGVTDALRTQLGAASDLRVFSRASTLGAATGATRPVDVAARLGAGAVLRGKLSLPNDSIVAIDVSIVRRVDGRVLWSNRYQRSRQRVLALEADIVRDVTTAVRGGLRSDVRERLATVRAVSPEVYEAYLKGKYEWNKRTPGSLHLAVQHFERAVSLDPTYAPAHAALADCYNQLGTVLLATGSPHEYRPRAASEAITALQLDPSSAEAHAALGYVWHYDLRWSDAEREFRLAIRLNPSFALAHLWYANLLMSRSRMSEAIEQANAARELDPFSLVINTNVGWVLYYARRYDDAIVQLRQTLALDSTYFQARLRLAGALIATGRLQEARAELHRLVTATDSSLPSLGSLAVTQARLGQRDSARALLSDVLARAKREYVPPVLIAHVLASLGEVDSAMSWMERAYDERSNAMAYLAVEPNNAPLRGEVRFQRLLTRAGLP